MTYIRWKAGEPRESRILPAMAPDHPAAHLHCPVCDRELGNGRPLRVLALGPDSEDSHAKCAAGGWFSARAIVLHAACLGMP